MDDYNLNEKSIFIYVLFFSHIYLCGYRHGMDLELDLTVVRIWLSKNDRTGKGVKEVEGTCTVVIKIVAM